jgi:cyclophilin family peptidyl-prolyl cis-trans isomerase
MKISKIVKMVSLLFLLAFQANCAPKSKKEILEKNKITLKNNSNPVALIETNHGDIVVELYSHAAPKTAANFADLASGQKEFTDLQNNKVKRPYYDGLIFHRIIPGFMLQGGDIKGDGTGGPGYKFEDEIDAKALGLDKVMVKDSPQLQREAQIAAQKLIIKKLNINSQEDFHKKRAQAEGMMKTEVPKMMKLSVEEVLKLSGVNFTPGLASEKNNKGTLSMANAGPNTNGSQFFLNLVDNNYLDGKHTVFGKVIAGFEVAEKIAKVERNERDKPKADVVMKKVRIFRD